MQTGARFVALLTFFLGVVCLQLSQPTTLQAQTNVGKILGVVRDPSGAAVPKATVTARLVSTGVTINRETNEAGAYVFPALPIGEYTLAVHSTGFKTSEHPAVHVVASEAVTIDFQLELGATTESVQVSALATKVDTTTTTQGDTLTSSEIESLPVMVNGSARNGLQMLGTLPGVIGGPAAGTSTSIDGGPNGGVGYYIDGTMGSLAGHSLNGDAFNPPPEALAELRLNATNDSEYGANSGVVMTAVTKSGTNQLHGDVFEYARNPVFNVRCWACASVDQSKQNEYGFTVGGPVVLPKLYDGRNRTFFFGVFTIFSNRNIAGGTVLTVPTAKMRAGDFSEWLPEGRVIYDPNNVIPNPDGPGFVRVPFPGNAIPSDRFSKISTYYQGFLPMPNRPGLVNNWIGRTVPSHTHVQKDLIKIDHNFDGGRQRITGYWDSSRGKFSFPGNWTGPIATGFNVLSLSIRTRASWQVTLGSNKVFGVRAALNRTYAISLTAPTPEAEVGGETAGWKGTFSTYTPSVSVNDFGGFGDQPFAGIYSIPMTLVPVNADLTWSRGNHNMKFGFSYVNNTVVLNSCFGCAGYANFGGRTGSGLAGSLGQGYADFLLGYPTSLSVNSPIAHKYLTDEYGFYAEDSWRVTGRLTMDFGLRLDLLLPPREAWDRITFVDPHIPNPAAGGLLGATSFFGTGPGRNGRSRTIDIQNPLSPHFGFAYKVHPRTVVRGSIGTSAVNLLGLFTSGSGLPTQGYNWSGFFQNQSTGINSTPYNWDGGFPLTPPPLPNIDPAINNDGFGRTWEPRDFKAGRSLNISFGIEQELPRSVLLKVGYVGNLSHGLPVSSLEDLDNLDPRYASLGNLLLEDVTSADAIAAGIKVPYPGFVGTVARALTPYPQFLGLSNIAQNIGFSLYHSLQASVQKRYGGLTFLGSYTISKQLDNYSNFSGQGQANSPGVLQNRVYRHQYKTLDNSDIPQTFVLSWVYELPFGPGKRFANSTNPVIRALVGGWRVSAIHTYQSGGIVTLSTSQSIPGFGPIWANRVLGVPITTANGCGNYDPNKPASNLYLNPAAFADPAVFRIGNTHVLPNVRQCAGFDEDVSLRKVITIHERLGLEIAADTQNIFNRHQWTGLNTNIDTAGFGQYTGTNGPRLLQLHAKLVF